MSVLYMVASDFLLKIRLLWGIRKNSTAGCGSVKGQTYLLSLTQHKGRLAIQMESRRYMAAVKVP